MNLRGVWIPASPSSDTLEDAGGFFCLPLPPPQLQGQQRSWQHSLVLQLAPRGPDFKLTVVHSWGLYTEGVRL